MELRSLLLPLLLLLPPLLPLLSLLILVQRWQERPT